MASRPNNRKSGAVFERKFCSTLSEHGFWCHRLAQTATGQPFDVIAARDGRSYPIDCKVCENDVFNLTRIEENQFNAMSLWQATGNGEGWFALQLSNGEVYMMTLSVMATLAESRSVLNRQDIEDHSLPLKEWMMRR